MKNQLIILSITLVIAGCMNSPSDLLSSQQEEIPQQIDYNFHVKPILSDRCFACHGPDAQKRKGDLRLDIEEDALAQLKSGHGRAIVPGSKRKSQLVDRILTDDESLVMPPPESNLNLTEREKAILIKWIEQGAVYKTHWAFTKPAPHKVPTNGESWAKNEIDHFIAQKLDQIQVKPAAEADKEQLIRRVYFDLTGLPPSLDDLDRILADNRTDYYERLVDSLLNLPSYGERMAAHWLDVARFADSEGYLDDFHHTFWPYRDWVIEAYNKNLPYDQFILWQMGGDQLPNANQEQILATAFNRNHKQNSEGGVIPEEFRVEYVADRTNTMGAAFMGLTVGCARCHDHKYDPVSQEEYFELFSFFNSTIERGDGIFSNNAIEKGQLVANELSMNSGPVLPILDEKVTEIRNFLLKQIDEKQAHIQKLTAANQKEFIQWAGRAKGGQTLEKAVDKSTLMHLTFEEMANGKHFDSYHTKPGRYWGSIEPTQGKIGKGVRSDAHGQLIADGSKICFERMEPFTVSFWVNVPKEYHEGHVLYNGNNRIQGYRGWDIVSDSSKMHFRLSHAHPYQSLDIRTKQDVPMNEWVHFVWTYDGSSKAEGMQVYQNGEPTEIVIERNYLYRSTYPYQDLTGSVYMQYQGLVIGNRHYDQDFTGGRIDEVRILNQEAGGLVAKYLYDSQQGLARFNKALSEKNQELNQFYDLFIDSRLEEERIALRQIQKREITTIDTVQEIMVMGDFEHEKPTFVLDRGVYDAYGKEVKRDVPEAILPWPKELPKNRLGLGQWLIHPDHPLTARVAVNQLWYLIYGRGLVETVEDFGNQGALPTHPELLDWLAVDFQKNSWNVKRLVRQLVTSATYRQSSQIRPELEELDPENYLLARGPRYRRSAEMVRDNVLAVSGLLNPEVGGPSAFPYQPPGLWKEVMTHTFFPEYEVDYEKGLYRRSIYTFWKRNMPPPSMLIFDAAHRGECIVRRQRSNTPLQALVLLNDEQMIEGCRVLAERMWQRADGDPKAMTNNTFRLLTGRSPNQKEQQLLERQYQDELAYFQSNPARVGDYLKIGKYVSEVDLPPNEIAALTRVSKTIMNTTEAYYKN